MLSGQIYLSNIFLVECLLHVWSQDLGRGSEPNRRVGEDEFRIFLFFFPVCSMLSFDHGKRIYKSEAIGESPSAGTLVWWILEGNLDSCKINGTDDVSVLGQQAFS